MTPDEIERLALERGGTVTKVNLGALPQPPKQTVRKPALVDPGWAMDATGLIIMVPVATVSETNARQWQGRSQRTQAARKAVRRACIGALFALSMFEKHCAAGGGLRVKFVRLGGHKMDHSNLPAACKATEDALAYLLGVDDGDNGWHPEWAQEPGGESQGMRIEVSKV